MECGPFFHPSKKIQREREKKTRKNEREWERMREVRKEGKEEASKIIIIIIKNKQLNEWIKGMYKKKGGWARESKDVW